MKLFALRNRKQSPYQKWRALIQINHLMKETRAKNKELGNGDGYGRWFIEFCRK